MTQASLEVARSLARKHQAYNIDFINSDIQNLSITDQFDIIVSTGVIHHLESPLKGLNALTGLLRDDGVIIVWLYHSLGEHQRLLDREVLLTMWERASGYEHGLLLLRDLNFKLETKRYGQTASQASNEVNQSSIDVDAYLHPIVNAYRLSEAIDMFSNCPLIGWAAINSLNFLNRSFLVDLDGVENGDFQSLCYPTNDLFRTEELRTRFRSLGHLDKLRVLEVRTKPTGFTIVGGLKKSYCQLPPRLQHNAVRLEA